MKSLLVDALRQQEEEKAPREAAEPAAASVPESDELELAPDTEGEAAGDAGIAAEATDTADAQFADAGELSLAPDETGILEEDDVHPLVSTMTLDVAEAGVDGAVPDAEAEPVAEVAAGPAPVTKDTPRLQRIAAFTPLFCLFLGSVSAGTYFAYAFAGAANLNADLNALPQFVGGSKVDMGPAGEEEPLFILEPPAAPAPAARPVPRAAAAASASAPRPAEGERPGTSSVAVAATSQTPEDLAYPLLEDAYVAWQAGDTAMAESLYRQALDVAPRHPNALLGLAAVLSNTGRVGESLPVYERLLSLEPDNAQAAAALVAGDDDVDEIRALLVHHSESAPLYFALGRALAARASWADARLAFQSAYDRAPERADYAFNLAVSLDRVGRYRQAETMYGLALSLADTRETVDRDIVVARLNELSSITAGTP